MRAALNMLVIMVIGLTILGCMFKSYRMLGMLENASRYAKQQEQEKSRFQQFSQEQKARENIRTALRQPSSLKMNPHPFGPRLEIKRLSQPFGQPLNLRLSPASRAANYTAPGSQSVNSIQSQPVNAASTRSSQPDSAANSVIKGWGGYVSTIENLEKD